VTTGCGGGTTGTEGCGAGCATGGGAGGPLWQAVSVNATAAASNREWAFIARSLVRRRNKRSMHSFDPGGKAIIIDGNEATA
jgi:hypothetical protein